MGRFGGLVPALLALAASHRSLPPGVTCGNQFNSSATALEIPEPAISWASYRILTCDAPIFWLKTQVAAAGQNLYITASVPVIARFDPVRISTLVIGPGLPALSVADQAKVPAAAQADIQSGEGALLFESPADQTSCAHLQSDVMANETTVRNGRCNFHEPYGDSHLWPVHDVHMQANASGVHRFAVFEAGGHAAKVAWACCDWPEDFTTAYPIPEADCPYCGTKASYGEYMSIFQEKASHTEFWGFPATQDCSANSSAPAPPAQCPNETAVSGGGVVQPESCRLGCSNGECHSHNIFGECVYELEWVIPSAKISGYNVTSLVIFKGDTVKFARKGHFWSHNLVRMADEAALDACDLPTNMSESQILTVEQVTVGTNVQFDTEGTFYYSCSMTGHCAAGQKLTVQVKDTSAGRHCHDHTHSGADSNLSMTCEPGAVKAYVLGDAQYGAASDQCSEFCTSPTGLAWISEAQQGSCAGAGFPEPVEKKQVQPGSSPMPMDVLVSAAVGGVSPTCHCHSFEEIKCDSSGQALYDEHIVEIQNYCQEVVNGTSDTCPYLCFQPFEILHLHYLACDLRPKHELYTRIEATDKCHMAAKPPFGTPCPVVTQSPVTQSPVTRDPAAYSDFWSGPKADGASTFDTFSVLTIAAVVVVVSGVISGLASWKHEAVESVIDEGFGVVGRIVGTHPIKFASASLIIFMGLSGGMSMQEAEVDPARLWVPAGAIALDHQQYTQTKWPSSVGNMFMVAMPKEGALGSNVLTPSHLRSMLSLHDTLMAIEVDGDKVVADSMGIANYSAEFGGKWTFTGGGDKNSKCAKWGPACAMTSVLGIFDHDEANIGTQAQILDRINQWAAADRETVVPGLNLYKGFEVEDVVGGVTRDANGQVVSAEVFMWSLFFTKDDQSVMMSERGRMREQIRDPINDIWEADAVCHVGVVETHPYDASQTCQAPAGDLKYTGLFGRSFGDEFGAAISNDISKIGMAYMLIIVYLVCCLGKRDVVHSMFAVSAAVLVAVGLSFTGASGFGALLGVKTNPLNNNIPFLLLGLGVDDAFVLVAELTRHMAAEKDATVPELISLTAKTGGSSILVTSITDALAFLVGASTVLPALSGFCIYGGVSVIMCFVLQITWVLPMLALNARRAGDNRYDCACCLKSSVDPHEVEDPQGCCCCVYIPSCKPTDNIMRRVMGRVGDVTVKTMPGKVGTIAIWLAIFVVGVYGAFNIKKDFKLEWFFPEGSYVRTFIEVNDEYFSSGTRFSIYTNELDVFAEHENMNELASYLNKQDAIRASSISNWWVNFRPDPTAAMPADRSQFYQDVWDWAKNSQYRTSIRWVDPKCNDRDTEAQCDPTQGVGHTRITATMKRLGSGVERFNTMAGLRADINTVFDDQTSMKVFPYAQDFLYWEENGIIDTELVRNLVIAGGIVFVIICTIIPKPRIAVIVSVAICMSIVELVGFIHWWGVSINGTTTIYILICLGLAVDYSAHIGHIFGISVGSATDRSWEAMTRIGPSVFHAVFSTILAVLVLSLSKSYVFEVFFKVLCLATLIAGFKGLWLLPVVLSLVGGSQETLRETLQRSPAQKTDAAATQKGAGRE